MTATLIGSVGSSATANHHDVTLSGAAAVGSLVQVSWCCSLVEAIGGQSVSDSRGNTYTGIDAWGGQGTLGAQFFATCVVAVALQVGDTITVTSFSGNHRAIVCVALDNPTGSPTDGEGWSRGTGTAVSSSAGGTHQDCVVAASLATILALLSTLTVNSVSGVTAGFSLVGVASATSGITTRVYSKDVAAAGTYPFDATITSDDWELLVPSWKTVAAAVVTIVYPDYSLFPKTKLRR